MGKKGGDHTLPQGEINQVLVDENDHVQKGQVLAQLDVSKLQDAVERSRAGLAAAEAQVAAADSAISAAESLVVTAQASVEAAKATIERIQADIDDSTLTVPRDGRVQYRVAQPGEVLGVGGKVLNIVDLGDVFMTFFLPTAAAGRLAIGAEARIVLDAAPQYPIRTFVSFVSPVAQFTPKTVETKDEREKLMFRVKLKIDPKLLMDHFSKVKTGVRGLGIVRTNSEMPWPEDLRVALPS